ncbi:hypothetical protein ACJ73_05669 [Blastomyces percursus]|uniref:Uncharacterized protein n=1 Tax=Blastomyces percursus TaxID=1658174 RepID=A0A1J9R4Q5_9EURO|nr:hypothetical protein ACJ73_05669 [Blastomyces percursus]
MAVLEVIAVNSEGVNVLGSGKWEKMGGIDGNVGVAWIRTITTISLATNFPTLPSVIYSVVNSYKNLIAIAVETEYGWSEIEELKDRIANPEAYAVTAPVVETGKGDEAKEEAKAESEEEESEEEEEEWNISGKVRHRFPVCRVDIDVGMGSGVQFCREGVDGLSGQRHQEVQDAVGRGLPELWFAAKARGKLELLEDSPSSSG